MLKIIFVVVGLWLVFTILRQYFNNINGASDPQKNQVPEDMVQCAYCKTHIPKSDSLVANGKHYCSETHLKEDTA